MNSSGLPNPDPATELAELIANLHATDRRLQALTFGEIDAVADAEGRVFLLRCAQERMRESESARLMALLDALPAHVALLNRDGVIVAVNARWRLFAAANAMIADDCGIGSSYAAVCEATEGSDLKCALAVSEGLRAILAGEIRDYSREYPCHSLTERRWFEVAIAPLPYAIGGAVVMHINITARVVALAASQESERRFAEMLRNIQLASVMLDLQGDITFCNDYLLNLTGWQREDVMGRNWFDLFVPEPRAPLRAEFARLLANVTETRHREDHLLTRSGELRLMRWNNSLLRSEIGAVIGTASIGEDITAQRAAEISIMRLSRVHAVLSGISALIVRVRNHVDLFQGACRIAVEAGGFVASMILQVDHHNQFEMAAAVGKNEQLLEQVRELLKSPERVSGSLVAWVIRERRAAIANDSQADPRVLLGEYYAAAGVRSLAVMPLLHTDALTGVLALYAGEIDFFHADEMELLQGLAADIALASINIANLQRLDYLALYDVLTGLPNIRLFAEQVEQFVDAARSSQSQVCVAVLDLEQFTQLNDRYGRAIGDELLHAVANRFRTALVEPFALSRIGADTFAVVAPSATEMIATSLKKCLIEALILPFALDGSELHMTGQLGIALFPADGDDGKTVLKNAEAALKQARTSGKRAVYFSHELNARIAMRLALEGHVRDAVEMQQFVLHYQARVDMRSGEIVGAEALIRWLHPERGLIAPTEFITLAEETGLIVPIGAWVLHAVCAQQAASVAAGLQVVPVAVNLSAVQFEKGDLLQTVHQALSAHALAPGLLELELTESAVMQDTEAAAVTLASLCKLGVGLALDDFGTGYSSLAHLKRFPFSSVKIDRSFIADITSNVEDAAIAVAIIAMAHQLKLKVVAEGVETQGQYNFLRGRGCDEMQGFIFSAAVPSTLFEAQLRTGKKMQLPDPLCSDLRTVLLVDDEPSIRAALTRSLRRDGYRILSANSGQEGLDLLALHPVQVIISDQRMPGMTGTEFLHRVSQLYPDTVRIILSGYTELSVVTDAVNRGSVFKFLTKPWDDDELRDQVRDAFRQMRTTHGALVKKWG